MSLLFDAWNAVTGTREAAAVHNMPPLCRFVYTAIANRANNDRRAYEYGVECIERDTGLGTETVRKCIADLVDHGYLLPLGWSGPRNNARRVYEVRLEGRPWEQATRKKRETPTQRRTRLAVPPDGSANSAVPPDGSPDSHRMGPRAPAAWDPAVPPDGNKPPDQPPEKPLRNPPSAPVRAHVRGEGDVQGQGQTTIPFGPSAPIATGTTSTPIPASGERTKKPRRAPGEPTAAERYVDAFVAGLADAGHRITPPRASDGALLGRVAATHARRGDGSALTGDDLVAWIRERAAAFRKAIARPEVHRGGISAFGLQTWLDNGCPVQRRDDADDDDDEIIDPDTWGMEITYGPPSPPTPPRLRPPSVDPVRAKEHFERLKAKYGCREEPANG